jgi:cell shape-determining protein MreD
MAVTTARPQRVSPVPSYVFGALEGLLFGYHLGVAALLYIKPEYDRGSVQEAS